MIKKISHNPFQKEQVGRFCALDSLKNVLDARKTRFVKAGLEEIKEVALVEISNAITEEDLLKIKSKYLGKRGLLNGFFKI